MSVKLDWRGPEIEKRVHQAEEAALRETLEIAASRVRSSHSWRNRTGALEASIKTYGVNRTMDRTVGTFGYDQPYGLFLEIGMRGRPGSNDVRGAGDREFKHLPDRIRKAAAL